MSNVLPNPFKSPILIIDLLVVVGAVLASIGFIVKRASMALNLKPMPTTALQAILSESGRAAHPIRTYDWHLRYLPDLPPGSG